MGLLLRAGQLLLGSAVVGAAIPSCYSAGTGTDPPPSTFYFPIALAVSPDGTVLYAVNSDFDLQYNGGTLQSYNLTVENKFDANHVQIRPLRTDTVNLIEANLAVPPASRPDIPFIDPSLWHPSCASRPPPGGTPLGEACAPPVDSTRYVGATAIIGAFATDLQISAAAPDGRRRLFVPVRGDASVTWADIGPDFTDFKINCNQAPDKRCAADHHTGSDPTPVGNTRHVTMPGEPFGMAQTEDGAAIAITHQSDTKTSLLTTGILSNPVVDPTMEFVLDGLPSGGVGIAAVPHDADAPVKPCEKVGDTPPCTRPAFLETSRTTAEIDLLRYYGDDQSSPLHRPFLQREAAYPITSNAVGTDSRAIVIDPTPRIACKALPGADPVACAQLPARVFFASRTPAALGIGEIGGLPSDRNATYDPDRLVLTGNVPLPTGPSRVYLAPIVDTSGHFALRVFIVCFDSSQIVIYDPDQGVREATINVGPGPFAMAFDPFTMDDVGKQTMATQAGKPPYRFAYLASFTESFVQMIDLDNSRPTTQTFEHVVFTLGKPTLPKGR